MRQDRDVLLPDDKREASRFRLSLSRDMGVARKTSKSSRGFIDSLLNLIMDFYGTVVEDLSAWTPSAPRLAKASDVDAGLEQAVEPSSDRLT